MLLLSNFTWTPILEPRGKNKKMFSRSMKLNTILAKVPRTLPRIPDIKTQNIAFDIVRVWYLNMTVTIPDKNTALKLLTKNCNVQAREL